MGQRSGQQGRGRRDQPDPGQGAAWPGRHRQRSCARPDRDRTVPGRQEQTIERLAKINPLERLGTPADISEVVSFLAGPGRWINGHTIYVTGGVA
jgi:NAD(P)-dependent dehydrogenase (short-subunit alcohol dehydrogenase family)